MLADLWKLYKKILYFRDSLRDSLSSLPFLIDLDIYMSGGYEPEEVEAEIEAVDQFFVPTHEGNKAHRQL